MNQSDQLGRSIKMIVYVEDGVTEEDNGYLFSLSYMEVFRITKEAGFNLKLVYFNEGKDNIYEIIEECRHDSTAGIWLASAGHLRKEQYEPCLLYTSKKESWSLPVSQKKPFLFFVTVRGISAC